MIPDKTPRSGENADKDGAYEQCIKLLTPVINPNDVVEVEQYFTGYGEIGGAKIAFYPSTEVFDGSASHIINGIKLEDDKVMNGGSSHPFTDIGVIITMQGIDREGWSGSTQFFDVTDGQIPQLYTETKTVEAPFKYELKTVKNIKPGTYNLEFVFTYFNGSKWVSSTKNVNFKVQNFLERHAILIGVLAILGSVSVLLRFAIYPAYTWLHEVISNFCV